MHLPFSTQPWIWVGPPSSVVRLKRPTPRYTRHCSGRSRSSGDGAGEWTSTKFGTIRTVPQLRHQLHHPTFCRYIAQTWVLLRHYRGRRHSKTKVPQNDCHRSCLEERDFIATFQALPPHRLLAIKCPEIDRTFTSSPSSLSPPRKFAIVGQSALNESAESLPQLGLRRLTHRPRHGIDAPTSGLLVLLKDLVYGREGSPGPESLPLPTSSRIVETAPGTVCTSQGAIVLRPVLQ